MAFHQSLWSTLHNLATKIVVKSKKLYGPSTKSVDARCESANTHQTPLTSQHNVTGIQKTKSVDLVTKPQATQHETWHRKQSPMDINDNIFRERERQVISWKQLFERQTPYHTNHTQGLENNSMKLTKTHNKTSQTPYCHLQKPSSNNKKQNTIPQNNSDATYCNKTSKQTLSQWNPWKNIAEIGWWQSTNRPTAKKHHKSRPRNLSISATSRWSLRGMTSGRKSSATQHPQGPHWLQGGCLLAHYLTIIIHWAANVSWKNFPYQKNWNLLRGKQQDCVGWVAGQIGHGASVEQPAGVCLWPKVFFWKGQLTIIWINWIWRWDCRISYKRLMISSFCARLWKEGQTNRLRIDWRPYLFCNFQDQMDTASSSHPTQWAFQVEQWTWRTSGVGWNWSNKFHRSKRDKHLIVHLNVKGYLWVLQVLQATFEEIYFEKWEITFETPALLIFFPTQSVVPVCHVFVTCLMELVMKHRPSARKTLCQSLAACSWASDQHRMGSFYSPHSRLPGGLHHSSGFCCIQSSANGSFRHPQTWPWCTLLDPSQGLASASYN